MLKILVKLPSIRSRTALFRMMRPDSCFFMLKTGLVGMSEQMYNAFLFSNVSQPTVSLMHGFSLEESQFLNKTWSLYFTYVSLVFSPNSKNCFFLF